MRVLILDLETNRLISHFQGNAVLPVPRVGELITVHEKSATYEVKQVKHVFPKVNSKDGYELQIRVDNVKK